MSILPSTLVVVALLQGGLVGGSEKTVAASFDKEGREASQISKSFKDISDGVVFDHIMIEPENPGELIPCVRVLRKYFNKSRHDDSYVIELRVMYQSGGLKKVKFFVVKLKDFSLTTHHPQPSNKNWRLADAHLDISDAPIDEDSYGFGEARLVQDGVTQETIPFTFSAK